MLGRIDAPDHRPTAYLQSVRQRLRSVCANIIDVKVQLSKRAIQLHARRINSTSQQSNTASCDAHAHLQVTGDEHSVRIFQAASVKLSFTTCIGLKHSMPSHTSSHAPHAVGAHQFDTPRCHATQDRSESACTQRVSRQVLHVRCKSHSN
jgi:hypothetical protein